MSVEQTTTYEGLLCEHNFNDSSDILYLSSEKEPLAEVLEWMISKTVTVRYWVTDEKVSKDEASEAFVRNSMGLVTGTGLEVHYSELTGYLFTDQEIRVGGHDLIKELRSHAGKWLILEVTVVDEKT